MQIEQWLKENKKTRQWLAKKTGIQYDKICRLIRGEENIMLMDAWEIYEHTKKQVRLNDWVDRAWDSWFKGKTKHWSKK